MVHAYNAIDAIAKSIRKCYVCMDRETFVRYIVTLGTGNLGNILQGGSTYLWLLMDVEEN